MRLAKIAQNRHLGNSNGGCRFPPGPLGLLGVVGVVGATGLGFSLALTRVEAILAGLDVSTAALFKFGRSLLLFESMVCVDILGLWAGSARANVDVWEEAKLSWRWDMEGKSVRSSMNK